MIGEEILVRDGFEGRDKSWVGEMDIGVGSLACALVAGSPRRTPAYEECIGRIRSATASSDSASSNQA